MTFGETEAIIIDRRFRGPPSSGNGGYSCAMIGRYIDGPAAVRLLVPPPLDTPLEVRRKDDVVELIYRDENGDITVGSARPASVEPDIPEAPDFATAEAASRRYRGFIHHFYPGCYVCGPERAHGDGLRIFAGPVEPGRGPEGMVAAAWVPDATLADAAGNVAPEHMWAALDCPGAYAFPEPQERALLLGELAVSIKGSVSVAEKCVVIGWEISRQGRRHFTGTALFGASGSCRGAGLATWFEVPVAADR
ncbi:MAG: hypothetical protein WBS20_14545 [Lysobacterales bacterium]